MRDAVLQLLDVRVNVLHCGQAAWGSRARRRRHIEHVGAGPCWPADAPTTSRPAPSTQRAAPTARAPLVNLTLLFSSFIELRALSRALDATSSCPRSCCFWACGGGAGGGAESTRSAGSPKRGISPPNPTRAPPRSRTTSVWNWPRSSASLFFSVCCSDDPLLRPLRLPSMISLISSMRRLFLTTAGSRGRQGTAQEGGGGRAAEHCRLQQRGGLGNAAGPSPPSAIARSWPGEHPKSVCPHVAHCSAAAHRWRPAGTRAVGRGGHDRGAAGGGEWRRNHPASCHGPASHGQHALVSVSSGRTGLFTRSRGALGAAASAAASASGTATGSSVTLILVLVAPASRAIRSVRARGPHYWPAASGAQQAVQRAHFSL